MSDADACYQSGMRHIEMSFQADYHSEVTRDLEAAIADFERALAADRDHVDAWRERGLAAARLGRHELAAASLSEVLRRRPEDAGSWLQRAVSLAALGLHELALRSLDEALRCRPDDADALFRRAEALSALARPALALTAWDEVLRQPDLLTFDVHGRRVHAGGFDARRLRARISRANALSRLGRRAEAVAAYRALFDEGHGTDAGDLLAAALRDFDEARTAQREHGRSRAAPGPWRVMGRDTFAREDFLVGEFATEAQARACVQTREAANAGSQDEALRDFYWLVPPGEPTTR